MNPMVKNDPYNQSAETYFILVVLYNPPWLRIVLPLLVLTVYLVTLSGNIFLIVLRKIEPRLHTPMYFFLSHLSFIDICFTTSFAPKILDNYVTGNTYISFLGCASQMCFGMSLGSVECLLLAIMAYDRHVAICQPLRYHVLMNSRICTILAASCWVSGVVNSFLHSVFTFMSPFCKSREVGHFICEIQAMLRLSCADTRVHERWLFSTSVAIILCAFLLILFSYAHIISSILKIHSTEGKSKVFSTCSSHLLVVIIFYSSVMSVYMRPISSYSPERDRMVSLMYTLVIPMCNPLIYSIRNKEVKGAAKNAWGKTCQNLRNVS